MNERAAQWLLALSVAGIVYGSLFPFEFVDWQAAAQARAPRTGGDWARNGDRADLVANVLLFIPFGLFAGVATRRLCCWRCRALLIVAGMGLAAGLQVAQLWLPQRVPDAVDLLANLGGLAAGLGLAALPWQRGRAGSVAACPTEVLPALLIGCWLAYGILEAVLTPGGSALVGAAPWGRPWQGIELHGLLQHAVAWLGFAVLWHECRLRAAWFRSAIAALLLFQLLLAPLSLFPRSSLAVLLALGAWAFIRRMPVRPVPIVAALVALWILVDGLAPVVSTRTHFHWVPFIGFLTGYMPGNLLTLLLKIHLYGALVWLIHRSCRGIWLPLTLPLLVTGLVEIAQTRVASGFPESSDPLLCVLIWTLLVTLIAGPQRNEATG